MKKILISLGNIKLEAELSDTSTAEKIWSLLPLEGKVNFWGDEIYFSIGEDIELEKNASDVISIGDLAYWPPGKAFCVFFGNTPASQENKIRAASAVNVFGKISGDATVLKKVTSGKKINVQKIE